MDNHLIHLLHNNNKSCDTNSLKKKSKLLNLKKNKSNTRSVNTTNTTNTNTTTSCKHYDRGCRIVSPCCKKVYTCRFCHDEQELSHTLNRYEVKKVVCNMCNLKQPVSQKCINCNFLFGKYFCNICNFFDNTDKGQYHCDKCGICRISEKGVETYHCDDCNICLRVNDKYTHMCTDIKTSNCPICLENLLTTTKSFLYNMKCKHLIHEECLTNMFKHGNYKCPICSISLVDMTEFNKLLDLEIKHTKMPVELSNRVKILCNDCNMKSTVKFHIIANKCKLCKSYNTRRI